MICMYHVRRPYAAAILDFTFPDTLTVSNDYTVYSHQLTQSDIIESVDYK